MSTKYKVHYTMTLAKDFYVWASDQDVAYELASNIASDIEADDMEFRDDHIDLWKDDGHSIDGGVQ